jgi:hypothetical protein
LIRSRRLAVSAVLAILLATAGVFGLAGRNNAEFVLAKPVFAHGVVDQSNLLPVIITNRVVRQILAFQPQGQEFVPSTPILVAVDVGLDTLNAGSGDDTITVNIRKGSISDPVLATASQNVPDGFVGLRHFDFSSPLQVTPCDTYVLEVEATEVTHGWVGFGPPDPYPAGSNIISGSVQPPGEDYVFQTYTEEDEDAKECDKEDDRKDY